MSNPAKAPKSQKENRNRLSSKTLLLTINILSKKKKKKDVELKTSFRIVSDQSSRE